MKRKFHINITVKKIVFHIRDIVCIMMHILTTIMLICVMHLSLYVHLLQSERTSSKLKPEKQKGEEPEDVS